MIDPTLRTILRSRYTITRFFLTFGGVLVILLLSMYVIASNLDEHSLARDVSNNFLGNFAATVAAFIITYAFYVFITPPGLRNADVIPLRDVEIADQILDLTREVSAYWFWGRSGSYLRTKILPHLDLISSNERRHVNLKVLIPKPTSENCNRYMKLKRGLNEEADEKSLAANVIATIVAVTTASCRNPYLHSEIALCPTVPVMRYDLSNSGALLTRDAKKLPAILVNSGNAYYEMLRDAVENEMSQSEALKWDCGAITGNESLDHLPDDLLKSIQSDLEFDEEIKTLAKKLLLEKNHRYANR